MFFCPRILKSNTTPTIILRKVGAKSPKANKSGKGLSIITSYQFYDITSTYQMSQNKKILVLENIRSAYNVGSAFRTADAVGIDKIILLGHTPAPIDRFGRKRKDIAKTALGAEENIVWEKMDNLENFDKKDFYICVVEQTSESRNYHEFKLPDNKNVLFVFGNEVGGVSSKICELADGIFEIPMRGDKESLNVSVSIGVFLYSALRI